MLLIIDDIPLSYSLYSLVGAVIVFFILRYNIKAFNSLRKTGIHPANPEHTYTDFWQSYETLKAFIFILTFLLLFIFCVGFGITIIVSSL